VICAPTVAAIVLAAMGLTEAYAQALDPTTREAADAEQATCPPEEASWVCALYKFSTRIGDNLNSEAKGTNGLLGVHYDGFVMLDTAAADSALTEGRQIQVRRAQIGLERSLGENWGLRGALELKTGRIEVQDLYVRRDWLQGRVVIGNQTEPFGLEEVTSAQYTTLLERSLPSALAPEHNLGAAYARRNDDWYWSVGAFGSGARNDGLVAKGYAGDARVAWSRGDSDYMIHLGAAISDRNYTGDELHFRTTPEVALSNVYLVDTGKIADVDDVRRIGIEYAQIAGAWTYQAEAVDTSVTRTNGLPTLAFRGAYAEASWFPWGGQRLYNPQEARFVAVETSGTRIVQFSARLSHIDLDDADIMGGRQTDVTLGATWFLTLRLHLRANWVYVVKLDGGPQHGVGEHDNAFVLRAQYDVF
jgi:phosphate-selective porin OprO and OprP